MVSYYLINDRKSQPCAARCRVSERLKELFDLFLRHTAARVCKCDTYTLARDRFQRDRQRTAVRHRLDRIACKVPKYLFKLCRIGRNDDRFRPCVLDQSVFRLDIGAVAKQFYGLTYRLGYIDLDELACGRPRVAQKVGNDAVQPVGFFQDDIHKACLRRAFRH